MDRRGFMKCILAAGVAPYVITTSGLLMPVKKIIRPDAITIDDLRRARRMIRRVNTDFGALTDLQKRVWSESFRNAVSDSYWPAVFSLPQTSTNSA